VNEVNNNKGYEAESVALKHNVSLQKQVARAGKQCLSTQIMKKWHRYPWTIMEWVPSINVGLTRHMASLNEVEKTRV